MARKIAAGIALGWTLFGANSAQAGLGDLVDQVKGVTDQVGETVKGAGDAVDDITEAKDELSDTVDQGSELIPDSSWHAAIGSQKVKLTGSELGEQIESGKIRRDTLVWTKSMSAWTPAGEVGALRSHFAAAPPDLPEAGGDEPPPLPTGR